MLPFLEPRSHPRALIGVKFCVAKRAHMPLSFAKFHINRCNESPLRGENPDFQPVSKFNTGSFRKPAGKNTYKHHIFALTACARCSISSKLCMEIEHVETIK